MGPRADYICTRCEEKGHCSADLPWRDLPVKDARCPRCGAKKFMQRLYNVAPHVSTNGGYQKMIGSNEMAGAAGYDKVRDNGIRARRQNALSEFGGTRLVPVGQLGSAIAAATHGRMNGISIGQPGESKPTMPFKSAGGVGAHVGMPRTRVRRDPEGLKAQ